ncbi:MAG TPA: nitroreductase family protein [Thermoplasmata archaeon]|nr:nitroreductase family protein [Thermoplasmata archaeon]
MEVMEAIKAARRVSAFKPQPVPEQKLTAVLGAARLADSVENTQPWKFTVVTDEDLKMKLAGACNGIRGFWDAPVVVVACVRMDDATAVVGGFTNSYPMDVGRAIAYLSVAAAGEGLGTAWVHAFNEDKVKALLGVPATDHVLGLTPLGYPEAYAPPEGRKHLNEIVSYNRFD